MKTNEESKPDQESMDGYTMLECVFCKGTGVAKCFDFAENSNLSDGNYDLNNLVEDKGTYAACPEGCRVMN